MAITGQSFKQLVVNMVAQAKASATVALDFTTGSINLALLQSVAAVALWLEALVLRVLAQSRASTSQGSDLDSWMADFGFARRGAVAAVGQVTFARFQPTASAVVPVGAIVATAVGGAQFVVTADPTNAAYSANAGGIGFAGYTVAAAVPAITVAAAAVVPGSAGNILPNTISLLLQPISGIDTATNGTAFVGGKNAEEDAAFRARFQAFIGALMKGTAAAYAYAVTSLQSGLTFQILENTAPDLTPQKGFVTICLDDGSGSPPSTLMQAAIDGVESVRCAGITVGVIPPQIVWANIAMTLTSTVTTNHAADVSAVANAVEAYINSLPVGATLAFSRLAQVAYDAAANVANVTGVTLNAAVVVPSAGGSGNAVGNVLTLSGGVAAQVLAVSGGAVTAAGVLGLGSLAASTTGLATVSSTGAGTGAVFDLTLSAGTADLGVTTLQVVKAGLLQVA